MTQSSVLSLQADRCHVVRFGLIYDRISRLPHRMLGRHIGCATPGWPQGCYDAATPFAICEHYSALPFMIDPAVSGAGALVITPVFSQEVVGDPQCRHLCATRITQGGHETDQYFSGESSQSVSLIFDHDVFERRAPELSTLLNQMVPKPVLYQLGSRDHERSAPVMVHDAPPILSAAGRELILGALATGSLLRANLRHFQSEEAFVNAYLAALSCVPSGFRSYASMATHLLTPSDCTQIAWSPNALDTELDQRECERLEAVGARVAALLSTAPKASPHAPSKGATAGETSHDNLLCATFEQPELASFARNRLAAALPVLREGLDTSRSHQQAQRVVVDAPSIALQEPLSEASFLHLINTTRLLSPEQMLRIAGRRESRNLARLLLDNPTRIEAQRLRNTLHIMSLVRGDQALECRQIFAAILPRDARVHTNWRKMGSEPSYIKLAAHLAADERHTIEPHWRQEILAKIRETAPDLIEEDEPRRPVRLNPEQLKHAPTAPSMLSLATIDGVRTNERQEAENEELTDT